MKIAFRFENGTSQLILTPENSRDKQYLSLCVDGRSDIHLKPTAQDFIIVEFVESAPKSIEPTVEEVHVEDDDPGQPGLLGNTEDPL